MKLIKIVFSALAILIVVTLLIRLIIISLPLDVRYKSEIDIGKKYSENIEFYQRKYKKLPESNDYDVLFILNPDEIKESFYPHYTKEDENYYSLTFVMGFDGPYLSFYSKTKEWKLKNN